MTTPRALPAVAVLVAVVLALLAGRTTDPSAVDGYGILFALPASYWIAVGLATVATGLLIRGAWRDSAGVAVAIPALWLFVAHTAPALANEHARFSIVYIHLGFIRVIDAEATGNILIDARFAWPGFFAAFVPALARIDPEALDWIVRLWPTAILAVSAVLVAALARRSYPNRPLIGPISSLAFLLLSWTGQDYFSPQSVGFLFYLSILVVLESGPLRPRGAWSSVAPLLSRFTTAGGDRPEARTTASFVVLLVLSFGAVVSHPLAPFFTCAALVVLAVYGRTVAWRLLLVVGITYVLWVGIVAEPWWGPRIDELTGDLGSVVSNFQSSTSDRVEASSPAHLLVTRFRTVVGLTTFLAVLVMGIVMGMERYRDLRPAIPLAPLAGIPVLAAGLQSYGGEIIIRVLLFTLPMAAILIARLLLALPRRVIEISVPALAALIMPVFLITRFGNEAFEMVTVVDREAVEVLYANGDDDTIYVADNAFLPWGDFQRERIEHLYSEAKADDAWLSELRDMIDEADVERAIVIFTPSQSAYRHHVTSAPPGSLDDVGRWLSIQPGVRVLYESEGGWVLAVEAGS
ncbi:MAG: hypothetical protein ACR2QO_17120 [Acidimicrobiales bacterium]